MCVRIRIVGVFGVVLIWNRDLLKTALKKDEPPRVESVKAVESVESVKKEKSVKRKEKAKASQEKKGVEAKSAKKEAKQVEVMEVVREY